MTNEEISLRTKKEIATALKKIMSHKTFSKITVSELIKECNINRKTFYYHFSDIYDLLHWIFEMDAVDVVKQYDLITDFDEAAAFIAKYVHENAYIINCAYDSIGRDGLKNFFYKDFIVIITRTVTDFEKEFGVNLSADYKQFLCDLYAEGVAGMIINYVQNPQKYNEREITSYFKIILNKSIPAAITAT